jgi:hypothetical protein
VNAGLSLSYIEKGSMVEYRTERRSRRSVLYSTVDPRFTKSPVSPQRHRVRKAAFGRSQDRSSRQDAKNAKKKWTTR